MWTVAPSKIAPGHRAAVAISQVDATQRHLGIAYRPDARTAPRLLHLAWHRDLRDDENVTDNYKCVLFADVPLALHPTIVAQCKRTAEADLRGGLPYGFGYTPTAIKRDSESGCLVIDGPSGLTCATFVLAILGLAGIDLVAIDTWQDRPDDEAWKNKIIERLKPYATVAHIEAVQRDRRHVRIRPEDVAGGATGSPLPTAFTTASVRGMEILDELSSGSG